jgi:hypothetical protein
MRVEREVSREIYLNRAQLSRLYLGLGQCQIFQTHTCKWNTRKNATPQHTHTHTHIDSTLSFNLSLSLARSLSLLLLFRVSHTLSPILAFLASSATLVEQLGTTPWPEAFRRRERPRAAKPMVSLSCTPYGVLGYERQARRQCVLNLSLRPSCGASSEEGLEVRLLLKFVGQRAAASGAALYHGLMQGRDSGECYL